MTTNKTYYPQAALVGFGSTLADKLGIDVEYTTGAPRTNGTTIFLPKITGAITEADFLALCGTAVHEAAHVYFNSVPRHLDYIDADSAAQELRAACMNAVLDVADETRMEWVLDPAARTLLKAGNHKADLDICTQGRINGSDPVWEILATAILMARLGRASSVYATMPKGKPETGLKYKAYGVLKGVRTFKAPKRHKRTGVQWSRLKRAADDLVALLKHLPPPAQHAQIPTFGQVGSDAQGMAFGAAPGANTAGPGAGANVAESGSPTVGGNGCGTGAGASAPDYSMNMDLYGDLVPALAEPVRLMAEWEEADGPAAGYTSGAKLGKRLDRAYTDGRVFVRREGEGERLSLVLLLDVSGSMYSGGLIADALAVAQAFADAVRPVAENLALYEFDGYPRKRERFDGSGGGGGTNIQDALKIAHARLADMSGRRVCVIVTDGQSPACGASEELMTAGVRLIVIAYNTNPAELARNMPGAEVIHAETAAELASQLAEVAGAVAR